MGAVGGQVRVKGPLGLSRSAWAKVVAAERPMLLRGSAEIGRGTLGAVRWELAPVGHDRMRVTFIAGVERASLLDRVLLVCGGRWWLERIVRAVVGRLGAVLDA